jgi:hypothetical protein
MEVGIRNGADFQLISTDSVLSYSHHGLRKSKDCA